MSDQSTADMLSSEIKKIRLRISDYYRSVVIEPILLKMWKLMISIQYETSLLKAIQSISHIPLATDVYERLMQIFEVALGVYFQSSYYVAKRPVYKQDAVFFERFCYDYVSLFGVNILFLELDQLELITRKVYSCISFRFDGITPEGGIQLRDFDCIEPAFTEDKFAEVKKKIG